MLREQGEPSGINRISTAEDPGTIRQWMNRIDLTGLRCQPERSRRDMKKLRGLAEVQPRFDSVAGGIVDGNAVMRAQ